MPEPSTPAIAVELELVNCDISVWLSIPVCAMLALLSVETVPSPFWSIAARLRAPDWTTRASLPSWKSWNTSASLVSPD
ncbi:hypothetical protein D9M71_782140 [compost metagenome]